LASIEELRLKLLEDPVALERFSRSVTVHVTSMFRDAGFYQAIREQVVPVWRTYPFIRLWVAGCSTGEEVYSLAILLREEGLYQRCRLYATDVSETILAKAKSGIFPLSAMQDYTRAYHEAGGRADFSDYYTADREVVVVPAAGSAEAAHRVVQLVTDSIPRALAIPTDDVQVVTPVHRGPAGTVELNAALKARLNPHGGGRAVAGFDPGDRVVATANHLDLEPVGFANGEVGVVTETRIDPVVVRRVVTVGRRCEQSQLADAHLGKA